MPQPIVDPPMPQPIKTPPIVQPMPQPIKTPPIMDEIAAAAMEVLLVIAWLCDFEDCNPESPASSPGNLILLSMFQFVAHTHACRYFP
jgi:hypothetical protein